MVSKNAKPIGVRKMALQSNEFKAIVDGKFQNVIFKSGKFYMRSMDRYLPVSKARVKLIANHSMDLH
jgi:hypothetical protein